MRLFTFVLFEILFAFLFGLSWAFAQDPALKITSVDLTRNPITITFDLIASGDEEYESVLYIMIENDQGSKIKLEQVNGDIGTGKFAGVGRKILWDRNELKDTREGARYQFELAVRKTAGGGIPWYVYPAVAAAGVVTYIAIKKPPTPPPSVVSQIPVPPDRP